MKGRTDSVCNECLFSKYTKVPVARICGWRRTNFLDEEVKFNLFNILSINYSFCKKTSLEFHNIWDKI